ncbi:MAG: hypothetical protein WBR28_27380 [Mycobacterium sp.]
MTNPLPVSMMWDVHIAYLRPRRWDELAHHDADALKRITGHSERPSITVESVAWDALHMTPRWLEEDSSRAVAALQPSLVANQGATEWQRFRTGAPTRGEVALAISMIGGQEQSRMFSPFGPGASVSLPGSEGGFESVGGAQISLAAKPTLAEGLDGADRDLASRLVTGRDLALPWWSLHLSGAELFPGAGGGPSRRVTPAGTFSPLLITGAGEVVAAVWTSPDEAIRHYIVPWLRSWTTLLEWLGSQAIPAFIPGAARRLRATVGEEPRLQTTAELSARSALATLERDYQSRHDALAQQLADARQAADAVRHDLLFGSSTGLENAVSRVLTDASCQVTPLDSLLASTASADLLVAQGDRRRLVEVKSASGNASERLVDDAGRHLNTWPQLRPEIQVEGITLIVNHQTNTHPLNRSAVVYTRPEFVQSLTLPVITTLQLFDAWRHGDFDAIRKAVYPGTAQPRPEAETTPSNPGVTPPSPGRAQRRGWWRR